LNLNSFDRYSCNSTCKFDTSLTGVIICNCCFGCTVVIVLNLISTTYSFQRFCCCCMWFCRWTRNWGTM